MKVYLLLFSTVVSITSALPEPFDFVEESIRKYASNGTEPCEDFYRHVCPIGSPPHFFDSVFKDMVKEFKANEKFPFKSFEIANAFYKNQNVFKNIINSTDLVNVLTPAFETACNKNLSFFYYYFSLFLYDLGLGLDDSKNSCDGIGDTLTQVFADRHPDDNALLIKDMKTYGFMFDKLRVIANEAHAHIDANIQQGILETEKLGVKLLEIAEKLLLETPWAEAYNVTEQIANFTSNIHLYTNLEEESIELQGTLFSIEKTYSECKMRFGNSNESSIFCEVITMVTREFKLDSIEARFFLLHNAMNFHPIITFGFPSLYHAAHAKEFASKLGVVGFIFGHEIAHSFIDDYFDPKDMGFFSKNAQDCIQDQYDKTCKHYKEDNCITADIMLDDNGSDIFGMQLAYKLLEEHYGENITNMVPGLGVSYEQLFFYAFAYPFCSGEKSSVKYTIDEQGKLVLDVHASDNVRVNAVAQHPGFKKAFSCPDDSRMMQSVTEQCIIYGEGAPDSRKKI